MSKLGNLVTIRYTSLMEPIEEWVQHLFPGAMDFKKSTSDVTMSMIIGDTTWTFLGQVQPGQPGRSYIHRTPWLRFHDPYFVVQAFLEMMTLQQEGYDNLRIYAVTGHSGHQMTFLCGEPKTSALSHSSFLQRQWDDTWSETFCYQVREHQTTRDFLRSINFGGCGYCHLREGRPFHEMEVRFRNGDFVEIEFEQCSDDQWHHRRRCKHPVMMRFLQFSNKSQLRRSITTWYQEDKPANPIPLWELASTTPYLFGGVLLTRRQSSLETFLLQTGPICRFIQLLRTCKQ